MLIRIGGLLGTDAALRLIAQLLDAQNLILEALRNFSDLREMAILARLDDEYVAHVR